MKGLIKFALILMVVSPIAFAQYNPPEQVLSQPVTNYQKAQAERLRQEQMRLENERRRQEIERNKREARREEQERLRRQREERERAQARTLESDKSSDEPFSDTLDQLQKLGEMKDRGYLTDEEYLELKTDLLESKKRATRPPGH